MGEGRAAGGPWGDGRGTGDLGRRRAMVGDASRHGRRLIFPFDAFVQY